MPHSLDEALEKRQTCRAEPVAQHMNTEHVDVGTDYSDAQVAETFLHHRVLIVPVTDDGPGARRDHAQRTSSARSRSASGRADASRRGAGGVRPGHRG